LSKIVIDGTVNSRLDNDKARKVVSLVIGIREYERLLPVPSLDIRRRLTNKRIKVVHGGRVLFDKPFVYKDIEGALIITFKPYKGSPKYVEKLRTLLGGEVYGRVNAIAQGNLMLGGSIIRPVSFKDHEKLTLDEIKAIVTNVSSAKSLRPAEKAA
jgi:hypothetical protein